MNADSCLCWLTHTNKHSRRAAATVRGKASDLPNTTPPKRMCQHFAAGVVWPQKRYSQSSCPGQPCREHQAPCPGWTGASQSEHPWGRRDHKRTPPPAGTQHSTAQHRRAEFISMCAQARHQIWFFCHSRNTISPVLSLLLCCYVHPCNKSTWPADAATLHKHTAARAAACLSLSIYTQPPACLSLSLHLHTASYLCLDDVGVHAGLGVVVKGDKGPVGHNTTHVLAANNISILTDDQVLCVG